MSREKNIGVIVGDGIGPEIYSVCELILKQLNVKFNLNLNIIKFDSIAPLRYTGEKTLKNLCFFYSRIKESEGCILRTAVYAYYVYKLREIFNHDCKLIFFNREPLRFAKGIVKNEKHKELDLLLIRQNSTGQYHGIEKIIKKKDIDLSFTVSKLKIENSIRLAFEFAEKRRKLLHLFIKGDVNYKTLSLWQKSANKIKKNFRDVIFDWEQPDYAISDFFINPEQYDVVLAQDIEGDIFSDLIATLFYGTRNITPSINLDPVSKFSSYQTVHGGAEAIAGKGIANPLALIFTAIYMLEMFFNEKTVADYTRKVIKNILSEGYRTQDLATNKTDKSKILTISKFKNILRSELK